MAFPSLLVALVGSLAAASLAVGRTSPGPAPGPAPRLTRAPCCLAVWMVAAPASFYHDFPANIRACAPPPAALERLAAGVHHRSRLVLWCVWGPHPVASLPLPAPPRRPPVRPCSRHGAAQHPLCRRRGPRVPGDRWCVAHRAVLGCARTCRLPPPQLTPVHRPRVGGCHLVVSSTAYATPCGVAGHWSSPPPLPPPPPPLLSCRLAPSSPPL